MSRSILVFALTLLLAGCGFQMRTATVLPSEMERTYIATDSRYSLFYRTLRERLRSNGVNLVDNPVDATAVFNILDDSTGQRVLSVSARNIPREYEVYYHVRYSLQSMEKTLLESREQILTRDYTYDVNTVLGKAREEELLREAIVDDLVRVVLIQLSSADR
ncbi:MAG: hypothetical protein GXP15_09610 [Gammaproteobacteria bacterium]|nr:hypothetical protein [Gammaproteobacteria bacterium]